jgi:hypothetical protein
MEMNKMDFYIILISISLIGLMYLKGIKKGLFYFLIIIVPFGIMTALLSRGYFFGEIGRYIFLIILIVVAIIVNNKKYKQYFKMKITRLVENFKKNEK